MLVVLGAYGFYEFQGRAPILPHSSPRLIDSVRIVYRKTRFHHFALVDHSPALHNVQLFSMRRAVDVHGQSGVLADGVDDQNTRLPVDVYRTPRGWLLKFDLAGVRPEEVSLSIEGCRVTIQGVRRDWMTEEGCSYYRMEITYNHFERSVELPCNVEPASIVTDYRHGMLLVHLTTSEGMKDEG